MKATILSTLVVQARISKFRCAAPTSKVVISAGMLTPSQLGLEQMTQQLSETLTHERPCLHFTRDQVFTTAPCCPLSPLSSAVFISEPCYSFINSFFFYLLLNLLLRENFQVKPKGNPLHRGEKKAVFNLYVMNC